MSDARVHDWRIPDRELERHETRRGRRHAYERLDATRAALVVVDLLRFFVEANPYCRGIVPNVNRLAGAVREAGGVVAWVVPEHAAGPTTWARDFYGDEVAERYAASGGAGPPRGRVFAGLDVDDADVVAEKSSASAFFPGRSSLPAALEGRVIDTVLVTGTVTNVCCEATARDAATVGHRVVFVADANAGVDDESHNATLRTIYRSVGDVRSTTDVVELLAAG